MERSVYGRSRNEGLVPLHVQDEVESRIVLPRHDFGDALGARLVRSGRQYCLEPGRSHHGGDFRGIGRDHDPIAGGEFGETADDSEDEGFSGEEPERLARQAAGAQPSRNHA